MSYTNEQQQWMSDMRKKREIEKLRRLQQQYPSVPDYSNMSLQDELRTRFDMDEINQLQQKYGFQQQTPFQLTQVTTPVPQTAQPAKLTQPTALANALRKVQDSASIAWNTVKYTPESFGEFIADVQIALDYKKEMDNAGAKLVEAYGTRAGADIDNYYHPLAKKIYKITFTEVI